MAQYDILLTQNVHATLIEYTEQFVNITKGDLLSANGTNVPTVLAGGTDGYILAMDSAQDTGLNWIDPATLGVAVANQGNDRIVTATATADALNAEANLTYNPTQGLTIGSGIGIVFAAAATTYKIYTADGAVKSNITIETGSNSAAGAGDITIKAGAGISAGGNVYFQRDTTYGDFFFGTGAAGQLPTVGSETDVIFYEPSTGKISYGASGGGNVTKVGTPVDNQVGVWTGDGTIEGDTQLTYNDALSSLYVGIPGTAPYTRIGFASNISLFYQYSNTTNQILGANYSNTAVYNHEIVSRRYGGTIDAIATAPTNAIVSKHTYAVHDGSNLVASGEHTFQVDGAIATADFNTKYTWSLKEGAGAAALMVTLGVNGFVYAADHSTDMAAEDRWIPDKAYVDSVSAGGAWKVTANLIEVNTAEDNVRLNVNEVLQFNSDTSHISGGGGTGTIYIYAGGSNNMHFAASSTVIYHPIVGQNNQNLGGTGASQWFSNVYAGTYNFAATGYNINTSGTDMRFTDGSNTNVTLSSLVGGSALWTRAASTLTPATSTDHVQLGSSANLQLGGATNTYITGATGANIQLYVSGNIKINITPSTTVFYQVLSTNVTNTIDIGTSTSWFKDVYAQRYYLDEEETYIYSNAEVLTFVDGTTGSRTLAQLAAGASGTVTAVNNGSGMNFTNITTSGSVTLGTPTTLTSATTNAVTTSSHTHVITTGILNTNIVKCSVTGIANNDYAKFNTTGLTGRNYAEVAVDIDASLFSFSSNNTHSGAERYTGAGSLEFEDDVELFFGTGSDWMMYFATGTTPDHLILNDRSITAGTNFLIQDNGATRFTFNMAGGTGTATDWIATSDVRAKTNIKPFELDMDKFLYLGSKAIRHNWQEGWGPADSSSIGFIAQDIEKFFPELVSIGKERPYIRGISYGKMVTVAIKATAQTWQYAVNIDAALGVVRSELEDLKIEVEELKTQLNTIQNG